MTPDFGIKSDISIGIKLNNLLNYYGSFFYYYNIKLNGKKTKD